MWEYEHSVEAPASRERVWAVLIDVPGWPTWNPGVGYAELDGPLREGATGTIHGVGGPKQTLRVLSVDPERRLVTESSERFARLLFEHELSDASDGRLRITERVRMTGPATPILRRTAGTRLERTIPDALSALAARGEAPADA